jgi:hypothetical protein
MARKELYGAVGTLYRSIVHWTDLRCLHWHHVLLCGLHVCMMMTCYQKAAHLSTCSMSRQTADALKECPMEPGNTRSIVVVCGALGCSRTSSKLGHSESDSDSGGSVACNEVLAPFLSAVVTGCPRSCASRPVFCRGRAAGPASAVGGTVVLDLL